MGRKEIGYAARMQLIRNVGNISVGKLEWIIPFRDWGLYARLILTL